MTNENRTAVSTMTASSLAGLGEEERRVLSYSASIGKEFDFSVLAVAVEMEEEPLAEVLERLVHRGILKELKGGDVYAFAREETFAQAYRDISSSRLRVIHKKIAEAYEKLYSDPPPNVIPEMGRHFHLGRVHDKSLLYNRYAATQAMAAFSPEAAIHYLERAREDLAALPGDHKLEEAEVLKEIGGQYGAMGEDVRADEFYGESLKRLPEGEVTLRALLILSRADTARRMDNLKLMRQYCEEAMGLLEKVGHKKGLAMVHRSLARAALKEARYDLGRREIEATLSLLDPEKDAREFAGCYIDLGNVDSEANDPNAAERAIEFYRKAIKALEPLNEYHELARAHNNLALTLMPGKPVEAMEEMNKARMYSEKAKDRRSLAWRLFNGVEIHLALGKVEDAARDNDEAGKILSLLSDPFGIQQVALNQGIIAQYRKLYEEAERAYLRSLKRAEELGYPSAVIETLVHLATLHADWGKGEEVAKEISRIQELGEDKVYLVLKESYEKLKRQFGHPSK
jgi:tetratricopeptide (TPR) repeat protein